MTETIARYVDCDHCGERYHGEDAIGAYIREVEQDDEVLSLCTTCSNKVESEKREFRFPADRLETLDKAINKLARRARKIGAVEPTYTVLSHFDRVWMKDTGKLIDTDEQGNIVIDPDSVKKRVRFVAVRIDGPIITVDGWTFAATVEHTEAGNAVKRAPYWMGVEEDIPHGYRDGAPHCDHCNTVRRRKYSFLVTDGNGGWKQIGRNCLADFLGRDPRSAAWSVMFWEKVGGMCEFEEEGYFGGGGYIPTCHLFDEFITATFHSVRKEGWLSRSAAYQSYDERTATADLAWSLITPIQGSDRFAREAEAHRQSEYDSIKPADREKAEKALTWTRDNLEGLGVANRSDYDQNLHIALCKPSVDSKDSGIVASLVVGYKRNIEDELKRRERASKSNEHVGTIGERVHGLTLLAIKFREFDSDYGARIMAQYEDADGNSLILWGGKYPEDKDTGKDADVGDTVTASWTIKDHKEYKGRKQTLLTRPAKTKVQKGE